MSFNIRDSLPENMRDDPIMDEIHTMLRNYNLSRKVRCDKKCQQDKKSRELYNEYLSAKNRVHLAPEELEHAERNYYTFTKGGQWYQDYKEEELKKEATAVIKELSKQFNENIKKLNNTTNMLVKQVSYNRYLKELNNKVTKKIENNKRHIEKVENKKNIADREAEFYLNTKNTYVNTNYYMLFAYICTFIILVGFMIYKKAERIYMYLSGIILIFPFIVYHIINFFNKSYAM